MRWPWVARWIYDKDMDETGTELQKVWDLYHAEHDRYSELLGKYHALKVQGAAIPEAPKPVAPVDPVSAAITQAARHDPRLRALMAKEASRMRDAQFSDHEIIEAIQNGVTSLEGLPA